MKGKELATRIQIFKYWNYSHKSNIVQYKDEKFGHAKKNIGGQRILSRKGAFPLKGANKR